MGDRIYGCDDCQEVCPPNRVRLRRRSRAEGDGAPLVDRDPAAWVDLLGLLEADDEALLARHGRWYVADRDPRHLRRNALVALGNVADPADARVAAALARVLGQRRRPPRGPRGLGRPPPRTRGSAGRTSSTRAPRRVPSWRPPPRPPGGRPSPRSTPPGEAPPRHQRLPAQDGRHPAVPLGAVAPAAVGRRHRAHRVAPRRPGVGRGPGPPHRAGAGAGAAAHPLAGPAHRRAGRRGRRRAWSCSTPPCPSATSDPDLARPYGVVLHGAEVTVPGRLPGTRGRLARVLVGARLVVAAGGYPADEAERAARRGLPVVVVPPGRRHRPLHAPGRTRRAPRPGPATASAPTTSWSCRSVGSCPARAWTPSSTRPPSWRPTRPRLRVLIGGGGRDEGRLARRIRRTGAPARLLGRFEEAEKPDLYGAADVFAMLCRDRWAGLEQEGFGIVFLEAAACGVPQVAGASGGAAEAVADGVTGTVVERPHRRPRRGRRPRRLPGRPRGPGRDRPGGTTTGGRGLLLRGPGVPAGRGPGDLLTAPGAAIPHDPCLLP